MLFPHRKRVESEASDVSPVLEWPILSHDKESAIVVNDFMNSSVICCKKEVQRSANDTQVTHFSFAIPRGLDEMIKVTDDSWMNSTQDVIVRFGLSHFQCGLNESTSNP